jgi:hypothetical protein
MARFLAGIAAAFLLFTGAFLVWQSKAASPQLAQAAYDPAPAPPASAAAPGQSPAFKAFDTRRAPEATPKSREQKRFGRADKNDDGRIDRAELFDPRRKAFAKLDANGNGALSFEEWATKTVEKFASADRDRSGWLSAAEYATTAPPPPKRKASCSC